MTIHPNLAAGARNLLVNCAGLEPGAALLILHEPPEFGWYDLDAPLAVATVARTLGMTPTLRKVAPPAADQEPGLAEAIAAHDCIVYFARIGDQSRFADPVPGKTEVICYLRDASMLASSFGRTDHRAMQALKIAIDDILFSAEDIEVTCALGTAIRGTTVADEASQGTEVSIRRFPLGVTRPVPAATFSGAVMLARYLTPTGSKVYDPPVLRMDRPVAARIEKGRIAGFDGDAIVVGDVETHYRRIAEALAIDARAVHSWHAGFHPGCAYRDDSDPDRWSNTVFNHPRWLHFHTCGDYAPGEICWMLPDCTVRVDGAALWDGGSLRVNAFAQTRHCLREWQDLTTLFA